MESEYVKYFVILRRSECFYLGCSSLIVIILHTYNCYFIGLRTVWLRFNLLHESKTLRSTGKHIQVNQQQKKKRKQPV